MLLVIDTTQEHDYRPLLSQTEEAYDGRSKGEQRHVFVAAHGHEEQSMITTWLGNTHLITEFIRSKRT